MCNVVYNDTAVCIKATSAEKRRIHWNLWLPLPSSGSGKAGLHTPRCPLPACWADTRRCRTEYSLECWACLHSPPLAGSLKGHFRIYVHKKDFGVFDVLMTGLGRVNTFSVLVQPIEQNNRLSLTHAHKTEKCTNVSLQDRLYYNSQLLKLLCRPPVATN